MVRNSGAMLFPFVYLLVTFAQERVLAQYINGNYKGNYPCRNLPIQRNLPLNMPMRNNWAIMKLPAPNNRIPLPNYRIPCPENPAPSYSDLVTSRMSPEDRIALRNNLLRNLKIAASNLLPIAEKISILYNLISANRDPAGNPNVPVKKLNVPIVNEVPFGAIRVARNLPIANFEAANTLSPIPNDVQLLRRGQINYQSIGGVPLNSIARVPISRFRNIPLSRLLNMPADFPDTSRYSVNNLERFSVNNPEIMSYENLAKLQRRSILSQPPPPPPPSNIPIISLKNILDRLQMADRMRKNIPNINSISSVNLERPMNYNIPVEKMLRLRYNNLAPFPAVNGMRALASSNPGRVVAKVPVVPYNSLARLPVYNGLPVIKVSESVYRLTPVNNAN